MCPETNCELLYNESSIIIISSKITYTGTTALTSIKSELMKGPPDSGDILCCEVCGKYGLPQDFSASGRFCSLSCVGSYTGRRNKGREFTRHVTTVDGKVIKKRRKGKGKKTNAGKQAFDPASVSTVTQHQSTSS